MGIELAEKKLHMIIIRSWLVSQYTCFLLVNFECSTKLDSGIHLASIVQE